MALTDAQKAQVRRYLGFPDVSRSSHAELESSLGALSTEGESYVGDLLTALASIQTKLSASWDRQKVVKAEEVTLAGDGEIRALRAEGRRLAWDLGTTLGVEPRRDAFGGAASSGVASRGA